MRSNINKKRYLIRAVKYMIYLAIFFFLILGLFVLFSDLPFHIYSLFRPGTGGQIVVFWLVISLIYPLFGYTHRDIKFEELPENLEEKIEELFENFRFKLTYRVDGNLKFIHRSLFTRAMRMFEDTITVTISENKVLLEGQRKDIFRIARSIEYALREEEL